MQANCVPTPVCIYHVPCALLFLRHLLVLFCINLISLPTPLCPYPTSHLVPLKGGQGRGRQNARYQSRKSVHEANQQTQLLLLWFLCCLPCSPVPPPLLSSPPPPLLFIFHSCFRLHALNQFALVSSARHSSSSGSSATWAPYAASAAHLFSFHVKQQGAGSRRHFQRSVHASVSLTFNVHAAVKWFPRV